MVRRTNDNFSSTILPDPHSPDTCLLPSKVIRNSPLSYSLSTTSRHHEMRIQVQKPAAMNWTSFIIGGGAIQFLNGLALFIWKIRNNKP
jgi:hypothetical protein